jgi:hypothetical protein
MLATVTVCAALVVFIAVFGNVNVTNHDMDEKST